MAPSTPRDLSEVLRRAGYRRLFQSGDDSATSELWRRGENREPLSAIVGDGRYSALARLLAAEMLHRHDDRFPPAGWEPVLGRVYADALELTGTGDRPIALTGNAWGFLFHAAESGAQDGPLGRHLLAAGPAAIGQLVRLLDDPAPIFYEGSQDAMLGGLLGYRVKDAAAYFIGKLTGELRPLPPDVAERDREIGRLREEVATDA